MDEMSGDAWGSLPLAVIEVRPPRPVGAHAGRLANADTSMSCASL
jgi:hypothetical protein